LESFESDIMRMPKVLENDTSRYSSLATVLSAHEDNCQDPSQNEEE
jgi:hypothetical protein